MYLGIVFIVLIALIAFFHYTQGFFSATLSAVLAALSAMVAVGWQEDVVGMFKPGKFADSANAMVICGLFAITYTIGRILLDKLVTGNVRFQSTIDKIGSVLMGIVAGIFATGIAAIAVQSLGFGPSIAGYARYALANDHDVRVPPVDQGRALDRKVYDQMKNPRFDPADIGAMILPVDSMVLNLAASASSGVLSGRQPLTNIHPDYLQELYGQRVGIEIGARRTAANFAGATPQANVSAAYLLSPLRLVAPGQIPTFWPDPEVPGGDKDKKTYKFVETLLPKPNEVALILHTEIGRDASDKDDLFRFSMSAIRLVVNSDGHPKNIYPIGTMDETGMTFIQRIDDPLAAVSKSDSAIDLVFVVDPKDVVDSSEPEGKSKTNQAKLKPGIFLEVKRLARVDLSETPGTALVVTQAPQRKPGEDPMLRQIVIKKPFKEPTPAQ